MDGKSLDLTAEKKAQLKKLFPDVFSEDQIDWERLRLSFGEDVFVKDEHYELSWAGKAEARKEIQKQTTATLLPDRANSVNFDDTGNIFIAGENLEVLRILQKSYFGKIKMIYIDPPYNTGSDSFVYPDDYTERKADYEQRAGITDEHGFLNKQDLWKKNTKENGQFHSVWLSMMYPRLYLARNLLREDGVMFVSIDDNEAANLKLLMDEIFGEENFVACICWQKKQSPQNDATYFSAMHDFVLAYTKMAKVNKNDNSGWQRNLFTRTEGQLSRYKNPDDDVRGLWCSVDCTSNKSAEQRPTLYYPIINPITQQEVWPPKQTVWRFEKSKFDKLIAENRIWWGESGKNFPRAKRFLNEVQEGIVPSTWWEREFAGDNQGARREIRNMFDHEGVDFETPTPALLIKRMLQLATNTEESHLVLDFFAGSGTTAQAVLELNQEDGGNRRFLLVQLPEALDEQSEACKAGYKTIADICTARIKKVIAKLQAAQQDQLDFGGAKPDLGFKAYTLDYSNFKAWRGDVAGKDPLLAQLDLLREPLAEYRGTDAALLTELCLKSGFPLSADVRAFEIEGCKVYDIADGAMWIALERVTLTMFHHVAAAKPARFVTLGNLFTGEKADETMSNAKLQLAEAGVELKII